MECLKNLPTRNPASFMSSAAGDNSLMQKVRLYWVLSRIVSSRLPAYNAGPAQCLAGDLIMRSADRAIPIGHLITGR